VSLGIPATKVAEEADAARRLVKRISRGLIELDEERLSITVGISSYPKDGRTPRDLYSAAAEATKKGKRLGGDCVILS
jgi:GGDEF domain-containing protein